MVENGSFCIYRITRELQVEEEKLLGSFCKNVYEKAVPHMQEIEEAMNLV